MKLKANNQPNWTNPKKKNKANLTKLKNASIKAYNLDNRPKVGEKNYREKQKDCWS